MVVAVVDSTYALNTCYWTGSAWANRVTHDGGIDQYLYRDFDFAWESTGSKGLLVWSPTAGQITYRTFTAPNAWGHITNVAMGMNCHLWVQLRTNLFAGATKIMGAASENTASDLGVFRWDGTTVTMIGSSTFTSDIGGFPGNEGFDLKYREASAGGTGEVQYTVCKDLSTSNCGAVREFTKLDRSDSGTRGPPLMCRPTIPPSSSGPPTTPPTEQPGPRSTGRDPRRRPNSSTSPSSRPLSRPRWGRFSSFSSWVGAQGSTGRGE